MAAPIAFFLNPAGARKRPGFFLVLALYQKNRSWEIEKRTGCYVVIIYWDEYLYSFNCQGNTF